MMRMRRSTVFIVALVFFLSIFLLFGVFRVSSDSMNDTLADGDHVIGMRMLPFFPDRIIASGDIVVFRSHDHRLLVKRVIARAGDSIAVSNGGHRVLLNNHLINELYVKQEAFQIFGVDPFDKPVRTIQEGRVFVMGDNRYESHDSREFGDVPIRDVIAVVICCAH